MIGQPVWIRLHHAPLVDAAITVGFATAAVWSVWVGPPFSDGVPGPHWLMTLFALLMTVPLLWRRRHPLLVECLGLAGFLGPSIFSASSTEGLANLAVIVAVYTCAAYLDQGGAAVGLGLSAAAYGLFLVLDSNVRDGRSADLWASAFFGILLLASWLAGRVVSHSRRRRAHEAALAERERESAAAVTAERSRIAHELHDIVSHNLSVVVVQAAGARAQGAGETDDALMKIEESGRQALVEMRRLLGVLRDEAEASLSPQPDIAALRPLADRLRAAGLPVQLTLDARTAELPAALQLTIYRIVQEALTNTLKYAPGSHTDVVIACAGAEVTVDITDDGPSQSPVRQGSSGGHGLRGMRERVERYGGHLSVAPRTGRGFAVHARLPVQADA